jgi:hypothetical protein
MVICQGIVVVKWGSRAATRAHLYICRGLCCVEWRCLCEGGVRGDSLGGLVAGLFAYKCKMKRLKMGSC